MFYREGILKLQEVRRFVQDQTDLVVTKSGPDLFAMLLDLFNQTTRTTVEVSSNHGAW